MLGVRSPSYESIVDHRDRAERDSPGDRSRAEIGRELSGARRPRRGDFDGPHGGNRALIREANGGIGKFLALASGLTWRTFSQSQRVPVRPRRESRINFPVFLPFAGSPIPPPSFLPPPLSARRDLARLFRGRRRKGKPVGCSRALVRRLVEIRRGSRLQIAAEKVGAAVSV